MRSYKLFFLLGALFVVAVIAWRLLSTSYTRDLHAVCDAESRAGTTVDKDWPKVMSWLKTNVDTPEGVALVTDLGQKKKGEAADELRAEVKKAGISQCPLADSYAAVQQAGDYRADLARLCAGMDFPNLETQGDAERLERLKDWAAKTGKSPKTASLLNELGTLPADQRGKRLRDEADANGQHLCEVGKTLDKPRVTPPPGTSGPMIRMLTEQINGNLKPEDLRKHVTLDMPKFKKCYEAGLAKKADLQGRMIVKFAVSEKGKVERAIDGGGLFPDGEVSKCVLDIFNAMDFGSQTGAATTVFLPIDFSPELAP